MIDQTNHHDSKMVSDEANDFDPDDPDSSSLNWGDED
jgi:hypothetical protein